MKYLWLIALLPALTASAQERRDFPSVFEAWNPAQNLNEGPSGPTVPLTGTKFEIMARHDLVFLGWQGLWLHTNDSSITLASHFTPQSIQMALKVRASLLALNPHIILLAQVDYRSSNDKLLRLPPGSPVWKHDASGNRIPTGEPAEYGVNYFLDFGSPLVQHMAAEQCAALVKSGVFDGCMLDWWHDKASDDPDGSARVGLIKAIRAAAGPDALILGNVNGSLPTKTAADLNGMYMEGFGSPFFPDWHTAATNLIWGETHLRKPGFTALEGWWKNSRNDYALMRMVTTLALVFSNGYVLFSDPNALPTPDHLHDWYPFWDKSLGRPMGPLADPGKPNLSGAFMRAYEKGEVVFNPSTNKVVTVRFDEPHTSVATHQTNRSFTVQAGDGDIFLKKQ
ncbi:putative glycoside hydrolase [Dinghuibacter silviterrae]|uniref:Putative glycosyl hydrolase-like family 15 (GHL15) protein n=1 Tax=Dinghuibacter silviterrae TaxID=1539049 RepID=A0A4R8DGE1_9BACT|nr:putative glycoside hydrolase [Dinghuibacter silviterrae]TDW96176.1 putative glycosyl hydrolase-like family 15 (GHL15) protein [Dinghuibacter silviterrae]